MGTLQNVLFLITMGIGWAEIKKLVELLRQIANNPRPSNQYPNIAQPTLPRQVLLPRDAFYCQKRRVIAVEDAIGHVSAETISAYPPGSAVIVAGEEISQEVVEYLKAVRRFGGVLKGASDGDFNAIPVLDI